MTDIIYPTHPDLTGMPTEFTPNKQAAPMANPYQVQTNPPQDYPQPAPQPAAMEPAAIQVVPYQPEPEPVQSQAAPVPAAVPAPVAAPVPAPVSEANLLEDVTWPNAETVAPAAPAAPTMAPVATPYIAPQVYAAPATPQTVQPAALNTAPSPAYPPMPSLQPSALQTGAAAIPLAAGAATAASGDASSKSLIGSLKQRFGGGNKTAKVKTPKVKKAKAKKGQVRVEEVKAAQPRLQALTQSLNASTPNIPTPNFQAPNIPVPNVQVPNFQTPNMPNVSGLADKAGGAMVAAGAMAGTAMAGTSMAEASKTKWSSKKLFIMGLLSGVILTFGSLALLDILTPKKEYAASAAPVVEKLNDDLAAGSTTAQTAVQEKVEESFLDEQLNDEAQ